MGTEERRRGRRPGARDGSIRDAGGGQAEIRSAAARPIAGSARATAQDAPLRGGRREPGLARVISATRTSVASRRRSGEDRDLFSSLATVTWSSTNSCHVIERDHLGHAPSDPRAPGRAGDGQLREEVRVAGLDDGLTYPMVVLLAGGRGHARGVMVDALRGATGALWRRRRMACAVARPTWREALVRRSAVAGAERGGKLWLGAPRWL